MPNRRLVRREIIRELARLKRLKWSKLPYPRFAIQAESEINPEFSNDPDVNFSEAEAVGGFITPIPVRYRTPVTDIRLYFDEIGRPDLYSIRFFRKMRLEWNKDRKNITSMVQCFRYDVVEVQRNRKVMVQHEYLQTLRGRDRVNQLGSHVRSTIDGLEGKFEDIQMSADPRTVDARIEEVLRENERIQNGST